MKSKLFRAFLIVAVNMVILALLLAVLLLVYPFAANFSHLDSNRLALDPSGVQRFRPGLRNEPYLHGSTQVSKYRTIDITTNSEGFRDYDHPLEPPPDTYRIAVVGDSYVFGMDLEDLETFPRQLEGMLNRNVDPAALRFEVFNFGLPGLNFEGMGRVTQTFAMKYAPEMVIYSLICDDISNTDVINVAAWDQRWGWLVDRLPRRLRDWVRMDLYVRYKMLRYGMDYWIMSHWPELYRKRLLLVLDYLKQLARKGGYAVAVTDYCRSEAIQAAFEESNSTIAPRIELLRNFPIELNERNWHPTARSNSTLAEAAAAYVRRQPRLTPPGGIDTPSVTP